MVPASGAEIDNPPPLDIFWVADHDPRYNLEALMAKKPAPPPKKTVYRDSEDGQFVKKDYAEKHPKTTEKERVPVGTPPKK